MTNECGAGICTLVRGSPLAVFSDIHANLEALECVLKDIEKVGAPESVCLGDVVGYAANPAQCLERVRELGCPVVKGNHDAAVGSDETLEDMNEVAQSGVKYSRRTLTPDQRQYLDRLPFSVSNRWCEFVHASLAAPENWHYILGEADAREHFRAQARPICFCGHTHVPMVWHMSSDGAFSAWRGAGRIPLPTGGKTLINVGSVGQPRDRHPEACYAVFDPAEHCVEFRRVNYDIAAAREKIMRAKLPWHIAQRLSVGL